MARKVRKRPKSLAIVFLELLLPWLVMAAVAAVAASILASVYLVVSVSLGAALAATYAIHLLEKRRGARSKNRSEK